MIPHTMTVLIGMISLSQSRAPVVLVTDSLKRTAVADCNRHQQYAFPSSHIELMLKFMREAVAQLHVMHVCQRGVDTLPHLSSAAADRTVSCVKLPSWLTVLCCAVTGSACLAHHQRPPHLPNRPLQQQSHHLLQLSLPSPHLQVSNFPAVQTSVIDNTAISISLCQPSNAQVVGMIRMPCYTANPVHPTSYTIVHMPAEPANHNTNFHRPTCGPSHCPAALRYVMLCCAVLCCAVLCCAVLCCAVLCCATAHLCLCSHHGALRPCLYSCLHPIYPLIWEALQLVAKRQLPHHCERSDC